MPQRSTLGPGITDDGAVAVGGSCQDLDKLCVYVRFLCL
jgi:hypothetical protein